jgi:outer membrane cobalamin receptor
VSSTVTERLTYAFSRSRQQSTNLVADAPYVPTFGASKAPFAFSDFTYDADNILRRHFATYQADARLSGRRTQVVTLVADWDGERATLDDRLARTSLPASRDNVGISLQHQLLGRRGSIATSLRLEHNDSFGNAWVPRLSAAFVARSAVGLIGHTTLKANAGRGVKEPTVLQSFSPNPGFLGNPALLPERARTWDAGVEQRLANDRVRIEVTYFDNRYQDQITTRTTSMNPYRSQYVNTLGFTTARGAEAAVDVAPTASLRFGAGYTLLNADIFDRTSHTSDPTALASALIRRPRHSAFVRAAWTWRAASADLDGLFVGTRLDSDFSSLSPALTSSGNDWLWHLSGRYRITGQIDAYARVQNLTDREYMEPLGFPAWRRTTHVGLRLRF